MFSYQRDTVEQTYTALPYASGPHHFTQPARIGAMARLHGVAPVPMAKARILEIGCAEGGNLVPLAALHPTTEFYGFDIVESQIEEGRKRIAELGLTNIHLEVRSLTDIRPADGLYDYIICHGVYSWVEPEIAEHIGRVCAENMSEDGIGFVSFNALPGWHLKRIVRDMMMFRTQHVGDYKERVRLGRAFVAQVAETAPGTMGTVIKGEAERVASVEDFYVAHEYLECSNESIYFTAFNELLERHKLSYICESDQAVNIAEKSLRKIRAEIDALAGDDTVAAEQYADFFFGRPFRVCVITKNERKKHIRRTIDREAFRRVEIMRRFDWAQIAEGDSVIYDTGFEGYMYSVDSALCKNAMEFLHTSLEQWPGTVGLNDILAQAKPGEKPTLDDEREILDLLVGLYDQNMVFVYDEPMHWAHPSAKPKALPIVRSDAEHKRPFTTSALHEKIRIANSIAWTILPLLDGTRDHDQLVDALIAAYRAGKIRISDAKVQPEADDAVRRSTIILLHTLLQTFAKNALLAS